MSVFAISDLAVIALRRHYKISAGKCLRVTQPKRMFSLMLRYRKQIEKIERQILASVGATLQMCQG